MGRGTADTSLTKPGYAKVAYTEETLRDFRNCFDPVNGPLYFMVNHMKIQHPTQGEIPFIPFDYQVDLIKNYNEHRNSINLLGRQMGKTTVAAGYLLWYAMFKPNSTMLVAAHKQAGASEIMQRIRFAYESIPDHIRAGVTEYNKNSITFDSGSRIVSTTTTENSGRGMALTLVYLDEFAFVPPRIAKEFWTSISPTLSTGGKCIITSTPSSDEDQFAQIWLAANITTDEYGMTIPGGLGINGFKPLLATWDQHPDRDAEWAKQEEAKIGKERFRRENNCEFIIYSETLINPIHLLTLKGKNPITVIGNSRWYDKPNSHHIYSVSLDPSVGTGGDNAAIQVMDLTTMTQIGEWCHNRTPVEGQVQTLMGMLNYLKDHGVRDIYWSVENNSVGEAALVVIRDTGEESFPGEFLSEPKKIQGKRGRKGFHTSNRSKMEACLCLKRYVEQGKITLNSIPLISELKTFVKTAHSFAAKEGAMDDMVMSLMLNVRMINYISTFEDSIYDAVNSSLGLNSVRNDDEDETGSEWDSPMPIL